MVLIVSHSFLVDDCGRGHRFDHHFQNLFIESGLGDLEWEGLNIADQNVAQINVMATYFTWSCVFS